MTTALITHPACLQHVMPSRHPESPDRLRSVLAALQGPEFTGLLREQAPRATQEQLGLVHPAEFVKGVLAAIPQQGFTYLDGATPVSPGSGEAALRAAGAVVQAVDLVMQHKVSNAFCAVRPPGHHACPSRAMGFCLFNNVAVGALWARQQWKCQRVAVVDFDVHHGNGTQDIFEGDADLFYASTHQAPFYPGSGKAGDHGTAHNFVNAPLQAGAGGEAFQAAMQNIIFPALHRFQPDFIFISAGFDAHMQDPLANLWLGEEDYVWVTRQILAVAEQHCAGRVVSTLEGGYDLEALAECARAHVLALMGAVS